VWTTIPPKRKPTLPIIALALDALGIALLILLDSGMLLSIPAFVAGLALGIVSLALKRQGALAKALSIAAIVLAGLPCLCALLLFSGVMTIAFFLDFIA
jgi:hypothetical protein